MDFDLSNFYICFDFFHRTSDTTTNIWYSKFDSFKSMSCQRNQKWWLKHRNNNTYKLPWYLVQLLSKKLLAVLTYCLVKDFMFFDINNTEHQVKVALSQKVLENFNIAIINIPNYYPAQKIWSSRLKQLIQIFWFGIIMLET